MRWLGIDFETTGLDSSKDRITEIGAVLWDVSHKAPLSIYSELIYRSDYPELSEEIIELTGITPKMLNEFGKPPALGIEGVLEMAAQADYFIAHNAPFDKGFFEAEMARQGRDPLKLMWLDSRTDVDYPHGYSQKLQYLACHHGFVNPFSHRAVFDVLTMFQIVKDYDPEQIIRWANTPNVWIRAKVDYANRDKAKSAGYHWRPEPKWWVKQVKEFQVMDEIKVGKENDFPVVQVEMSDG